MSSFSNNTGEFFKFPIRLELDNGRWFWPSRSFVLTDVQRYAPAAPPTKRDDSGVPEWILKGIKEGIRL